LPILSARLIQIPNLFFAVLSIITGVGGAFAFTPNHKTICSSVTLYYYNGTSYVQVGSTAGSCQDDFPNEHCYYYDPLNNHKYAPCTDLGPTGQRFIPAS
jgi:hypothetical protein